MRSASGVYRFIESWLAVFRLVPAASPLAHTIDEGLCAASSLKGVSRSADSPTVRMAAPRYRSFACIPSGRSPISFVAKSCGRVATRYPAFPSTR